jgi:hypothetical protein
MVFCQRSDVRQYVTVVANSKLGTSVTIMFPLVRGLAWTDFKMQIPGNFPLECIKACNFMEFLCGVTCLFESSNLFCVEAPGCLHRQPPSEIQNWNAER